MPKQAQAMLEQAQPVPEQAQPMPEQAQPMPEQAQPMPEQAQPVPVRPMILKKQTIKDFLNHLSANETAEHTDYFLFLLGTDCCFEEKPQIPMAVYKRGETLSFAAQAIASVLGEHGQAEIVDPNRSEQDRYAHPLSYRTNSVAVINGPETLGRDVGHKIAEALFELLNAVACGKKISKLQPTVEAR